MRSNKDKQMERLKHLSNAYGVSGFEDQVCDFVISEMGEFELHKDKMKNVIVKGTHKEGNLNILLDAHSDEVGFMVQFLYANGTFSILPLGGWDPVSLPGTALRIRNTSGEWIKGIVASVPKHFNSQADTALTIADLRVDVGACSLQELRVDYGIELGAPVVPFAEFEYDEKHERFLGKAFDCRIGCASMMEVMMSLNGEDLNVNLTASFTSQEEVGDRGIRTVMNQVKPDLAIVFEGCPADDTFLIEEEIQTALGKGPMLRHVDRSMITHPGFQSYAMQVAKSNDIAMQTAVRSGGGTNGASIHTCDAGIPTIVIGVPVRYAHSHYGISLYSDYDAAVELAIAIIRSLTQEIYEEL